MNSYGADISYDPVWKTLRDEVISELAKHGDPIDAYISSNRFVSVEDAIKELLQFKKITRQEAIEFDDAG